MLRSGSNFNSKRFLVCRVGKEKGLELQKALRGHYSAFYDVLFEEVVYDVVKLGSLNLAYHVWA